MTASSCATLLNEYRSSAAKSAHPSAQSGATAQKLKFVGVGDKDVYNITAPFMDEGKLVIAGRVEDRNSEFSQVWFFTEQGNTWEPIERYPTFLLQDPFVAFIHDELVLGGVRVITDANEPSRITSWVTEFYRGPSVTELRHFYTGPNRMKDIRLVELQNGDIGVFTRPQGDIGGRGQIGFTVVSSLDGLQSAALAGAPLFTEQFLPDEWGGSNEARALVNGWLGVLGHIACLDEDGGKHYYPMTFAVNPKTHETTPLKIIATRSDFLPGPAKNSTLHDVVFSGGMVLRSDGFAELYAGTGDAEAQRLTLSDPFLEYEKLPPIV